MLRAGEATRMEPHLGHEGFGYHQSAVGDGIQTRDCFLGRAHPRGDLGADPGNGLVQDVNVGHVLSYQEALVLPDAPHERPLHLGDLLA